MAISNGPDRGLKVGNSELKKAGLKATQPRLRVMQMLQHSGERHMSAEAIYKALLETGEDVGMATVYRVLTQFEQAGLVNRHHFEGHSVFELNEGKHHDHILCTRCGRVDEFIDETIERRQHEIAESAGYQMTGHALYIYGLCRECRKKI
jgi:Fur family ferric uptake transcriptional regulator